MLRHWLGAPRARALVLLVLALPTIAAGQGQNAPTRGLAAFKSDDELRRYLTDLTRRQAESRGSLAAAGAPQSPSCSPANTDVVRVPAPQKADSGAIRIRGRVSNAATQQGIGSARVVAN